VDTLYLAYTKARAPVYAEETWESAFRKKYPCLHRPSDKPMDVTVAWPIDDAPLNVIMVVGLHVIRSDLLEALRPFAEKHLLFANLYCPSGESIDRFRVVGSTGKMRIRGGPTSTRDFCPRCGQFLYYPRGRWYLLRSDLTGQPVYSGEGLMGLVVNEKLYNRIRARRFRKLGLRAIPVRDEPLDGLPADLSKLKPGDFDPIRIES
jgi:hypothetical protein